MKRFALSFLHRNLAVVAFALFALAITSSPASAHETIHNSVNYVTAPCQGSECNNVDPYKAGCGTASSYNRISYKPVNIPANSTGGVNGVLGYIDNIYSSWCNANWAVVNLRYSSARSLKLFIYNNNNTTYTLCYPDNCSSYYFGTYAWTNMIDGTSLATACIDLPSIGQGAVCSTQ